jgi:hypothetical protein
MKETGPLGNLILSRESPLPAAQCRAKQVEASGCRSDAVAEFDNVPKTFDSKGESVSFRSVGKPGMHRYRSTGALTEKPVYQVL